MRTTRLLTVSRSISGMGTHPPPPPQTSFADSNYVFDFVLVTKTAIMARSVWVTTQYSIKIL